MKKSQQVLVSTVGVFLGSVFLSGCSPQEIAQSAADAAACRAGETVIAQVQGAVQSGVIDSGVLAQVDLLLGDQLDALLSTELAQLFRDLSAAAASTEPVEQSAAQITEINSQIAARCAEVGVTFAE